MADEAQTTPEQQAALDAYWRAETPAQERDAYRRMMELGLPNGYAAATADRHPTASQTSPLWNSRRCHEDPIGAARQIEDVQIDLAEARQQNERLCFDYAMLQNHAWQMSEQASNRKMLIEGLAAQLYIRERNTAKPWWHMLSENTRIFWRKKAEDALAKYEHDREKFDAR